MFNFIKSTFKALYKKCISRFAALFSKKEVNNDTLLELEEILLSSDVGVSVTRKIINAVKEDLEKTDLNGEDLQSIIYNQLTTIMNSVVTNQKTAEVIFLVGINGSGKTTLAGKLAHRYIYQGKKVVLVAADTFRSAAVEQLQMFAEKTKSFFVKGEANQDPASVLYKGIQEFKKQQADILIIDTAGRLQTKINLMHELEKMKRVLAKNLPDKKYSTLLTVDAILGQNSFEQAKIFKEVVDVSGIVLTKMDSSSKGGIVVAIADTLKIPVFYISFGEKITDLKQFNSQQYINDLLGIER